MRGILVAAALIAACGSDERAPGMLDVCQSQDAGVLDAEADARSDDSGPAPKSDTGPISCPDDPWDELVAIIHGPLTDLSRADADAAYAALGDVEYTPPPDRWGRLPRTRDALCSEKELRVTMLGDSIIANTSRSRWDEYLSESLGVKITKSTVWRGATGVNWYRLNNRIACYVAPEVPDLVIVGGISSYSILSFRLVTEQIRELTGAEVLLLPRVFGTIDPNNPEMWAPDPADDVDPFRLEQRMLADELGVAWFDITGAWGEFIVNSGQTVTYYKRDAVHANALGEQILGKLLAAYLDPRLGGNACE